MVLISTEMVITVCLEQLRSNMYRVFVFVFILSCLSCINNTHDKQLTLQLDENFKLKNGVLLYKNHPFSGAVKAFDSLVKATITSPYLKGKKHGEEKKEYDNKQLAEVRFYTNGTKTDIHKGWWENGLQKFEYHFNSEGKYNGKVKEWYNNGQIFKEFHFNNGIEDGSQKMWQSDGKIRANFVTKKGERFGLIGLKKCYSVNIEDEVIQ